MPAEGEVRIDWCPVARLAELQAFIDAQWKPGHVLARDAELLSWQHPRSDDALSVVLATVGECIVGILGVIPFDANVLGATVPGGWLTTWVVMPELRAQRVGLRLLEFVLARHQFVGTVGGNATTMRLLGALGFRLWESVPRWIAVIDESAFERVTGLAVAAVSTDAGGGELLVEPWSARSAAAWNDAWTSSFAADRAGAARTATYIEWRYRSHPRFDYDVRVACSRDGRAAGLLVERLDPLDTGNAVLRIVDLLGTPQAVACLAADSVERGSAQGAVFADFYCTSTAHAVELARAGFVREDDLPEPPPSRLHPVERPGRPLTAAFRPPSDVRADAYYVTRSDCDQDRPN